MDYGLRECCFLSPVLRDQNRRKKTPRNDLLGHKVPAAEEDLPAEVSLDLLVPLKKLFNGIPRLLRFLKREFAVVRPLDDACIVLDQITTCFKAVYFRRPQHTFLFMLWCIRDTELSRNLWLK